MKVLIAGASGLIGKNLGSHFSRLGYTVVALSRSPESQSETSSSSHIIWKQWRENDASDWQDELKGCDVAINLVGESLAGKRWTKSRKELLLSSRVNACKLFIKAIKESSHKPKTYVQASAIGIYSSGQELITEEDGDKGGNFLADLSAEWEKASEGIELLGIKRIILRIGLVLSHDSLIISKFKVPFKFFIGGHLGDGSQMMSWIHMDDLVNATEFVIKNSHESHIYNLTTPNAVSLKVFCKTLAKTLHRPSWLHVPAFILKLLFGKEMANLIMLSGETVIPDNLRKMGFIFKYPKIEPALRSLF